MWPLLFRLLSEQKWEPDCKCYKPRRLLDLAAKAAVSESPRAPIISMSPGLKYDELHVFRIIDLYKKLTCLKNWLTVSEFKHS